MGYREDYKQVISKYLSTDPENVFLYWKGRVALYALLKAAGIGEGDEVILSGLTCVVVPNAVKYLGARPVYVDVNIETYNPVASKYKEAISPKTRVVIIQNTFGLSSEVEEIVNLARANNLITIEDCTHGFGGFYRNKPNGTYCDAAIYSTQWNKPFSTGIGGFCLVNNLVLHEKLISVNKHLVKPGLLTDFLLSALLVGRKRLINNRSFWLMRSVYRKLSKLGVVIGSSQREELLGTHIPKDYFRGASIVQVKQGLKNISELDKLIAKRKESARIYTDFLKLNNKKIVPEYVWNDHSFLVYPILVKHREEFNKLAENAKIGIGDWFISPLHPVKSCFEIWDLDDKNVPNASYLSKHLVNLPTIVNNINGVLGFLKNNIENII